MHRVPFPAQAGGVLVVLHYSPRGALAAGDLSEFVFAQTQKKNRHTKNVFSIIDAQTD